MSSSEILDMWDLCRYEQYKYSDTETSPICSIFNIADVKELEKMENNRIDFGKTEIDLADPFLKLMEEDLKNKDITVLSYFTVPSVFQLLLKIVD